MDNQGTIWRSKTHRKETARTRWKAADSDLWNIADSMQQDEKWKTKWVKAHADDNKHITELTNEERGNVAADRKAEKQYKNPTNIDKPWKEAQNKQDGQILIKTLGPNSRR